MNEENKIESLKKNYSTLVSWKNNGSVDDLIGTALLYPEFTIRVEQMDEGIWWYSVNRNKEELWSSNFDDLNCKTMADAVSRATRLLNGYIFDFIINS